jgi:hypothetical protein
MRRVTEQETVTKKSGCEGCEVYRLQRFLGKYMTSESSNNYSNGKGTALFRMLSIV